MSNTLKDQSPPAVDRRNLFGWAAVGAALVASYGTLAGYIARFLYPRKAERSWFFVTRSAEVATGEAVVFKTPSGEPVNITRQGEGEGELRALSSTCPHLGCQVHWESHNNRFFCPCHNGVFDPSGSPVSGPPADANQSLLEYPVRDDRGMLFIELPSEELAALSPNAPRRRGLPVLERAADRPLISAGGACQIRPRRA